MKRILSIIAMFLFGISFLQSRTYIVCVGIADYPGRQNDLRVSANDAMTYRVSLPRMVMLRLIVL